MSARIRDRYAAGVRAVAESFWTDQLGTWRGLLEVVSGHLGAGRWAARTTRTWSRWASPSRWLDPFLLSPDATPTNGPPVVRFVVDRAAESTPEQEVLLRPPISSAADVNVTELRHVLGQGTLPRASLSTSLAARGEVLRLALVDLFAIQAKIQQGALLRGHYVGAVLAGEPPEPIALVDVSMEG
jgi:hypothetical protein